MVRDRGFRALESVEVATRKMFEKIRTIGVEEIGIYSCQGRVLASNVFSDFDVPEFDKAAMDGYAIIAEDVFGASQNNAVVLKVVGKVEIGKTPNLRIRSGEAVRVYTGSAIPENANAVVMLEHTKEENGFVQIFKSVAPYKNVVKRGEDLRKGELVLRKGTILQPQDAGILASLGLKTVKVFKKPKVAVISSGDELVTPGEEKEVGKIYNSNDPMICNSLAELGFEATSLGIAKDRAVEIEKKLFEALSFDAVVFTGGTSVGSYDLVPEVVSKHGELVFHGVAMRPGMPTAFGIVKGKPVFMLPGSPTACFFAFNVFVVPALYRMMGIRILKRKGSRKKGILQAKVASEIGIRSYVRVLWEDGKVFPLRVSGSSILSSIVKSNALLVVPEDVEGYEEGEEVEVTLLRDITEVLE